MLNLDKIIKDYYGIGENIIVPYSKKLTNGKEVNISKYSGLVSVVKRRNSKKIAEEWSKKIFGKKFSQLQYTSKIPAVIARHVYVLETMLSILNLKSKFLCDFGAGEGEFLKMFLKKKTSSKVFAIEPSKKNCDILKKNRIKNFQGTIEEYFAKKNNEKFDVVTLMWTLCNTSSCFDVIKCASELVKKKWLYCCC